MPIILPKQTVKQRQMLRDVRPVSERLAEIVGGQNFMLSVIFGMGVLALLAPPEIVGFFDMIAVVVYFYLRWTMRRPFSIAFKLPRYANMSDPHNPAPGKTGSGWSDGILYLGNVSDSDDPNYRTELWLTNTDARTHILYIGTTGSGKTEGLKSLVSNSLAWGSGFAYTDGKADTDLWASLYALARRFGRDDDILVLNYMTGNSDDGSVSNTMNPFANGSASYLANLITNLMPDAGGDNAMWKERAVALMFALMPALTFKRDKQGLLLDVGVVRDHLELGPIIRLSRDPTLPDRIVHGLKGYLSTLPGYVDGAFDDEGNERPPSPDQPMYDLQVARQQHGYLSMQFTRSLQSLADEYGYIFKAQLADIDVLDVVLNRRILVVLIPSLEKANEEAANLGKIVSSCLKGMMGMTLGNTVEGSWEAAIGSKQTRSNSSFMTVFDEVGYYTAAGMAVMAAQARSLGFSLVFATQDIPSMEKRIKTEARSIIGNCNLKILGRIEDPMETKEFVNNHGGTSWVMETRGFSAPTDTVSSMFFSMPMIDDRGTGYTVRQRLDYDHLRGQREGEAHLVFADWAVKARMFYAVPERVKALRVHRLLPVPGSSASTAARDRMLNEMTSRLKDPEWTASGATGTKNAPALAALRQGLDAAEKSGKSGRNPIEAGIMALGSLAADPAAAAAVETEKTDGETARGGAATGTGGGMTAKPASSQAEPATRKDTAKAPVMADMPADEKAKLRANLPPLMEGDQYAIEAIQEAPVYTTAKPGFAGSEADLNVVTPAGRSGNGDVDITNLPLPEEISSALAQSAKKLNDGLRGRAG